MSPVLKWWVLEESYHLSHIFNFDETVSQRRQKTQGVKSLRIKCGPDASPGAKLTALVFVLGLGLFSKVSA